MHKPQQSFLNTVVFLLVSCGALVINLYANQELMVLSGYPKSDPSEDVLRKYVRELSYKAFDRRLEHFETLKSVEQIQEHQQSLKQFLLEKLDLPKDKTPLNPRVINRFSYEDFSVEKIIFESQPGFYVTALFYLPQTTKPCPAVLVLCGHNELGKAYDQEICMGLVRNGIAALCIDPIGQGERKQILDEKGKGVYRATTEHLIAGVAPILLGRGLATYMVWDAIRSLDYLETRPEIDSSKMGVTGYSGGGNRGSYLMAIDDRIRAAAPGCYITTSRRKNDAKGPGDAEQNFHGQFAFGLDLPDYLIMAAPKPVLILSATQDFVPIEGTWEAFRQAKRIYTRLGASDHVGILETDNAHGYWPEMRVGAINWMRQWLMDEHEPVIEEPYKRIDAEQLLCTPSGQVLLMAGAKSVFDLNRDTAHQLEFGRKRFWSEVNPENARDKIRSLTGIEETGTMRQARGLSRGKISRNNYNIEKLILEKDEVELPALLFQPAQADGDYYIYLNDAGKHVGAESGGAIEKLVRKGHTVLAVDLRGFGETATTPWRYEDAHSFTGHDAPDFFIAYMLNLTFVGMRADDLLLSANYLKSRIPEGQEKAIQVVSIGETGVSTLHLAALEPQLFKKVTINRSLISWSSVVANDLTRNALNTVVQGGLQFYDLPDLVRLAGNDRIRILDSVDAAGNKIASE